MANENITFDKLPQAVGYLTEQVERIHKLWRHCNHRPQPTSIVLSRLTKQIASMIDSRRIYTDAVTVSGARHYQALMRANRVTNIPVATIHKAIQEYANSNEFQNSYINESSLTRFIQKFNEWKCDNLQGRFNYKKANCDTKSTALTNDDGSPKAEIVQGRIGVHMENGIVSSKYLYDTIAYDSDLERKNIVSGDIDEIIVYGKIPRKSIAIPTIANGTYSPDFMYVVKKENGQKELNIIVETKGVENKTDLRGVERAKIDCAKKFFEQLKIDGYTVHFKTQLNNKEIKSIFDELK